MLSVIVNGAAGRMGQEAVKAIEADAELTLVGAIGRHDNLATKIRDTQADVVVDLTVPDCVYENAVTILENKAHPVIGTSGLTSEQIHELQKQAKKDRLGGIIAPNFSLGAVLMMHFSQIAAKYMDDAEIIELHHPAKVDAPSGTSIKTASLIKQSKNMTGSPDPSPARGDQQHGVCIHSVRLSGLIAHQEVIFGGHKESLRIRHDSFHRESFMPGIKLACKKAPTLSGLVYGLEHVLTLT